MSVCYQLVGLPGVGKSTWAKTQQEIDGCVIISTDSWIEKVAQESGLTYNDVFQSSMRDAVKQMMFSVRLAQREQRDIIWDQTSLTVNSRLKKFNTLPEYEHIAVVFSEPDEIEYAKRLDRPGKHIPNSVIQSMRSSFEYPSLSEGFTEIWLIN